ncbi:hypothetical protein [Roseibium marinum]|uniref:Uncharacterized protein n=1 Tax=Roseibium marinum TaxID=281252 RepID=A0A2S3V3F7_9HYPH|nr:hypothetical protein [Roseibium marinum]POF34524.1 hypothetical protein CLV41_101980 [Roseibium marinum]
MCGEIDEQVTVGQDLLEHLRVIGRLLELKPGERATTVPKGLDEASGRAAYMEEIFRSGMAGALAGIAAAEEGEVVDALASQAIALGRLAGFLAGQLPPEADLFRGVIEAVTAGHNEPREIADAHRRSADHHHHDQGHIHGHDHDHHH